MRSLKSYMHFFLDHTPSMTMYMGMLKKDMQFLTHNMRFIRYYTRFCHHTRGDVSLDQANQVLRRSKKKDQKKKKILFLCKRERYKHKNKGKEKKKRREKKRWQCYVTTRLANNHFHRTSFSLRPAVMISLISHYQQTTGTTLIVHHTILVSH